MSNKFVICLNNKSNPASLIVGKVYRVLLDEGNDLPGMVRIIDEDTSVADGYLYPTAMFAAIKLPKVAEQVLMA